ncbi:MAG: hypothetical protein NVS4B10_11960 [Myxococcales bacterium]
MGKKKRKPSLAPPSAEALPFELLDPDFLGAFFELCFPDRRLLELCHELQLTTPGYRLEALPPDQVARILADEVLAAKDARARLDAAVRAVLRSPALEGVALGAGDIGDLLDLQTVGDPLQQLARVAWKALASGEEGKALALDCIEEGVAALEQQAKGSAPKQARPPPPDARQAEEAVKRADRAEKERAAMREQLAAARTEIAAREQKLAEQAKDLAQIRAEQARLSAEVSRLTAAGEGRALSDARRAMDEARALAEKLRASEVERAAALERADVAEKRLRSAAAAAPQAAAPAADELPSDEEAASFLVPVLTREFYDSIDRWDRRMQRAAFDKIHRLALDWRHGSLRAIPLEGVPGYYRIRVATDVRLIYRRDGPQLEVLSLIDREDLDRYIRQARTRPA